MTFSNDETPDEQTKARIEEEVKKKEAEIPATIPTTKIKLPDKVNQQPFLAGRVGSNKGTYGIFHGQRGAAINMNILRMQSFATRIRSIRETSSEASFLYPLQTDDTAYLAASVSNREGRFNQNTAAYRFLRIRKTKTTANVLLFERTYSVSINKNIFTRDSLLNDVGVLMTFDEFLSVCDFFCPLNFSDENEYDIDPQSQDI